MAGEIRVDDEKGTTHVFPDGSTPEMIAKAMGVKVAGSTPTATPVGGNMRPLTEQEQMETTYPVGAKGETIGENVHNLARNAFTGAYGVLRHPLDTVGGMVKSVLPAPVEKAAFGTETPNPLQSTYEGLNTRPGETLSIMAGQAAVMAPVSEIAGKGTRALRETSRNMREKFVRSAASTGPDVAKGLVKDIEKNRELVAKKAGEIDVEDQTEAAGTRAKDEAASKKHQEQVATKTKEIDTADQTEPVTTDTMEPMTLPKQW